MNKTLFVVAVWCVLWASLAFAQVPHLIRYQGQAVDSQGVPLEGPYTLTFRLYDAQTAGTKLWEEIQVNVVLQGGHFSVLLGQVTPLTAMDWSRPCWLSVQVGTDPELAPRQRITSVPLAIRAGVAETANTATVAASLTVPITTSTITDDANKLVPSGAIILWAGASCPAGYMRLSTLDGKFLVGGTTFSPAAGGSNTHSHGAGGYTAPSHTHSISGSHAHTYWSDGNADARSTASSGPGTSTDSGGGGVISGSSASTDSRPAFGTVLLCQKD